MLAQPVAAEVALTSEELEAALAQAEKQAEDNGLRGKDLTPFLLARLAELTGGRSVRANRALIVANARLAGQVATALVL